MRRLALAVALVIVPLTAQAQTLLATLHLDAMGVPKPFTLFLGDTDGDGITEGIAVSPHTHTVTVIGTRGATGTGTRQPSFLDGALCAEEIAIPVNEHVPHMYPQKLGAVDVILVSTFGVGVAIRSLDKVACR